MFSKTKLSMLLMTLMIIGSVAFASAQATDKGDTREQKRGWASRVTQAKERQQAERENRDDTRAATSARQTEERAADDAAEAQNEVLGWPQQHQPEPLVGTWSIHIPTSEGGAPPFNALQAFHDGGTFTESSDLLITQTEGPAFGVWKRNGGHYTLTFQLFVFDPDKKESVGMVRVRANIRMLSRDEFVADSVVDFIAPDGTIEKGIDRGPFYGKRIKVLPVR